MKILISAYACEPDKGSESEVGWSWVKYLSKTKNKVFVITRSNNRKNIEKKKIKNINFLYYDLPSYLYFILKGGKSKSHTYLFFLIWQFGAYLKYKKFINKYNFDYIHHVTFVTLRFPSLFSFCKSNFILGPVAGGEFISFKQIKYFTFKGVFFEILRKLSNIQIKYSILNYFIFKLSKKIILTSIETKNLVPKKFHKKCLIMPAISNNKINYNFKKKKKFRMYFAGRLDEIKGIEILMKVFKRINSFNNKIVLNIYGDGSEKKKIIDFININNLRENVFLHKPLTQKDYLKQIKKNDLLIFPTLRDSGGYVILEALNNNIAVISTNAGGPKTIVTKNSLGIVDVKNNSRSKIIELFEKKIKKYYLNSSKVSVSLNKNILINKKYNRIYKMSNDKL